MVVRVRPKCSVLVPSACHDLEGPGAHGSTLARPLFDPNPELEQHQLRRAASQTDRHAMRSLRFDRLDVSQQRAPRVAAVAVAVERGLDIGRGHRAAVVKGDVLSQVNQDRRAGVVDLPRFRQQRFQMPIGARAKKPFSGQHGDHFVMPLGRRGVADREHDLPPLQRVTRAAGRHQEDGDGRNDGRRAERRAGGRASWSPHACRHADSVNHPDPPGGAARAMGGPLAGASCSGPSSHPRSTRKSCSACPWMFPFSQS